MALKGMVETVSDFDNAAIFCANMGVGFYPIVAEVSPVVGAELGVGVVREMDAAKTCFDSGLSLGVQLFRTAATQMNLEM
jgi:hypothetical protein